jgi:CRISPR-associated protein Csb1
MRITGTDLQKDFDNGEEDLSKHPLAQIGLLPVPSVDQPGGIRVAGDILHLVSINLATIGSLYVPGDEKKTLALRRYILGLALVAVMTCKRRGYYNLRSGCHLFPKKVSPKLEVEILPGREALTLTRAEVLTYAQKAAADFGINETLTKKFTFNEVLAREQAAAKKAEADKKKAERAEKAAAKKSKSKKGE